jgi:glycosyltransferase involved in cell wall biosynthesis
MWASAPRATPGEVSGELGSRASRIACLPGLTTTTPYQALLYDALSREGFELEQGLRFRVSDLRRARRRVRYLHFHWQHFFYDYRGPTRPTAEVSAWLKVAVFAVRLLAARALGYRLVWTIHQLQPHHVRSGRRDRAAAVVLAATCHALIALDLATAQAAKRRLRPFAGKVVVTPQGPYSSAYPAGRTRETVRAELGLAPTTLTLLAFGTLRDNKNLLRLCDAFQAAQLEDAALVIAGRPWNNELAQELAAHAKADPRIRVIAEYVPSDRVSELFAAADLAVVARTDGGTSGVVVLTLSLGVPLLVADLPAARALTADGQSGWFFEPREEHGLRAALERIAGEPDLLPRKQLGARDAGARLSWKAAAVQTADILRGL